MQEKASRDCPLIIPTVPSVGEQLAYSKYQQSSYFTKKIGLHILKSVRVD